MSTSEQQLSAEELNVMIKMVKENIKVHEKFLMDLFELKKSGNPDNMIRICQNKIQSNEAIIKKLESQLQRMKKL
ncbi:hypothetical protein H9655_21555 [Cytobacillus sp. Sa5YUA1]|uniref:Spore coat protein n=1 Tax=Cytobacillus stercorigallinarum TaxID=2762240 RepID=A0ABR8QVS3_9BACI|nr:hypothetical protein [Cytobacillus stercorigallinarum]